MARTAWFARGWMGQVSCVGRRLRGIKIKRAISVPGPRLNMPRDIQRLPVQYIEPGIGVEMSLFSAQVAG